MQTVTVEEIKVPSRYAYKITVKSYPNWFFRMLGAKDSTEVYVGTAVLFNRYPSGESLPAYKNIWIGDLIQAHKMKSENI